MPPPAPPIPTSLIYARVKGGALALGGSGVVVMTDCEFRGNRAGGHGGAVYATDSVEVRATDVLFYDNEGGALAPPESCAIKIQDSRFHFLEKKSRFRQTFKNIGFGVKLQRQHVTSFQEHVITVSSQVASLPPICPSNFHFPPSHVPSKKVPGIQNSGPAAVTFTAPFILRLCVICEKK